MSLGDHVEAVKPDNLPGAAAARWPALSPEQRERAGLISPSHALREHINGHIRERLARGGTIRIGLVPAAIDAAGRESVPLVTAWPANPATALPAASWSGAAFAPVGTV